MKKLSMNISQLGLVHFVLLFLLLCCFAIALLFFSKTREKIYVDLTYFPQEWREEPMPPSFLETDAIKAGDSAYNWRGEKTIEITDVDKTDWRGARKSILITAQISVVFDSRTHQYTYNDIPILIGNKFTVNTERSVFVGQIINVYTSKKNRYQNYQKREAEVVIQSRWLEEWHAESLRDFQMVDSSGNTMVQVNDIHIKPAEVDVETDKGVVYKGFSTIYKDVLITLRMNNVYCSEQSCYFIQYYPLKVGEMISLQSKTDSIIDGHIVSFTLK